MHATLEKFGYGPGTVFEDEHWAAVVRPVQPTLGSLVLICKRDITSFGMLSPEEAAALPPMVGRLEAALRRVVAAQKFNYLMLMMNDPQVHMHVIPRYEGSRDWRGTSFKDAGWPAVPVLTEAVPLDAAGVAHLRDDLRAA
jgi:diadenosine tetraphosphate (Ap4A) HIT family hydrolase